MDTLGAGAAASAPGVVWSTRCGGGWRSLKLVARLWPRLPFASQASVSSPRQPREAGRDSRRLGPRPVA
eukprot:scaffold44422_cov57-Phaeocystis_antarctica.AAC.2